MRFSLLTLLLGCLTVGAGVGVYTLNGAWRNVERIDHRLLYQKLSLKSATPYAPDGRRVMIDSNDRVVVYDPGGSALAIILPSAAAAHIDQNMIFLDNDNLMFFELTPDFLKWRHYRRRYPEWWWGHFYRPEVWGLIVFGGLSLWNLFRKPKRTV